MNKRSIIAAANDHVSAQRELILDTLPHLEALVAERDSLLQQLNAWTGTIGLPSQIAAVDASKQLDALRQVKSHTFSAFTGAALTAGNAEESPESVNSSQTAQTTSSSVALAPLQTTPALPLLPLIGQTDPLLHASGLQNAQHDPGILGSSWHQPNYSPLLCDPPYNADTPVSTFLRSLQDQNQELWKA